MSSLSRRQWLAGALALGALPLAARGQAPASLRPGVTLPDPDFSRLQAGNPYVIGVRPYRKGGVRLELEPLGGGKIVVHHYGHAGAGMTLAFGTAVTAADLVATAMAKVAPGRPPGVAVIGTGVVGLATAAELRRRHPALPITVYARDLDVKTTTSWVAGGQFEPSGVWREYRDAPGQQRLSGWLRGSRDRIVALQREGLADAHGIAPRDNYTLEHELPAVDIATPRDVIPAYTAGALPFAKLRDPGRLYKTWLLNPTILLPRLAADLRGQGVKFVQRTFAGTADLAALAEDIVVNCTGYGARKLVGDAALIPQRGHLAILERTDPGQDYFFSGGCDNPVVFYVFCRQHDVVVGGTVLSGQDGADVVPEDAAVFSRLLGNGRALFGGDASACVP